MNKNKNQKPKWIRIQSKHSIKYDKNGKDGQTETA